MPHRYRNLRAIGGITECYLQPGRGDIPAVTLTPCQLWLALDLTTPEGCKAELT